jgi:hypothetical protein
MNNYTYTGSGTIISSSSAVTRHTAVYIYIASGVLVPGGSAITSHRGNFIYNPSGLAIFSGAAIIQIIVQNYIYLASGTAIFSGSASFEFNYTYTAIPASTQLRGSALYSFVNFQANFSYYPYGIMHLWNTGVNIDQIRYFSLVYRRYGIIISPLVDNNQPYTTV